MQQKDLKSLAQQVILRNKECNSSATNAAKCVQLSAPKTPPKVARVAEPPLAAKLRAAGVPIGLEVDGKTVAWLVSDEDAVKRTDLSPRFTALEAEVLAEFDAQGMRDLIKIKDEFDGTLSHDEFTEQ